MASEACSAPKALRRPLLDTLPCSWGSLSTPSRTACLSCAVVRSGRWASNSAATPVTWGVAIEVPLRSVSPLGGTVLQTRTPGAATSTRVAPKLEKGARLSLPSVAATQTMLGRS